MKLRWVLFTCGCLWAVVVYARGASTSEVVISFLQGDVTVAYFDEVQPAYGKMRILEGAAIETGDSSSAELSFSNGVRMLLEEKTRLRLDAYTLEPVPSDAQKKFQTISRTRLRLLDGDASYFFSSVLSPQSKFEVVTPMGVVASLGERFYIQLHFNERRSFYDCEVGVLYGYAEFTQKENGEVVSLGNGQKIALGVNEDGYLPVIDVGPVEEMSEDRIESIRTRIRVPAKTKK